MTAPIKIIDLFAGPGGLGEGFSSLRSSDGQQKFKIALSIEKEESAHKTLTLRAFYRQFSPDNVPSEYYDYLAGKLGQNPSDELYQKSTLKKYAKKAHEESRCLTLGQDNKEIHHAIDNALGLSPKPWVLIGGPPCQAYSLAGRARNKGNKNYCAENDHRNFLYLEYLRVIAKFQPTVFVMENVKGMLSAKINGKNIIDDILSDLKKPCQRLDINNVNEVEYEIFSLSKKVSKNPVPTDFIIKSEEYGVPQARHRVILLGIRKDISSRVSPRILSPNKNGYVSVHDVISDLPQLRSGLSKSPDSFKNWANSIKIGSKPILNELQKMQLNSTTALMQDSISSISSQLLSRGQNWSVYSSNQKPLKLANWYDPTGHELVCNHESRGHIKEDLKRYLFCSCYGASQDRVPQQTPKAKDFPKKLAPNHGSWTTGKFADRFRVQLANKYATTITSHISKDGHYYIHYDPKQCRSFTVREAARIQTFPDNYFFVGTRTQQYVQVGNAVPPYLANQIASIVFDIFTDPETQPL